MQAKWMSPTKLLYSEPMALKSEFWSWKKDIHELWLIPGYRKVRAAKCKASSSKSLIQSSTVWLLSVPNPDLEIRGWGEGRPAIRPVSPPPIFSALWASVRSKNKGGGRAAPRALPLDPPLIIKNFDPSRYRGSSSSVIRSRTGKDVSSILTWS